MSRDASNRVCRGTLRPSSPLATHSRPLAITRTHARTGQDLAITDDTRIRGSVPTIQYLQSRGAKVLLTSHLGRPKAGFEKKFSLAPVAPRLAELLGVQVPLVPDCR